MRRRSAATLLLAALAASFALGAEARTTTPGQTFGDSIRIARDRYDQARYPDAEALSRRLLLRLDPPGPSDSLAFADAVDVLADVLFAADRVAPGDLVLAERSSEIRRRIQGRDHPDFGGSLARRALLLVRIHTQSELAESLASESLEIRERALGPDHLDVASSLHAIGVVGISVDKYASAKAAWERCLEIRRRKLGEEHPLVGLSWSMVATARGLAGDKSGAQTGLERSIAILEKACGPDDPRIVPPLVNLGRLLQFDFGDDAAAAPLYERAIKVAEVAFGPMSPRLAVSLLNLADLYLNRGDYERTRVLLERAGAILEATSGIESQLYAWYLNTYGLVYLNTSDLARAQVFFERALAIREKGGPDDMMVAYSLVPLGGVYRELGDPEAAEASLRRAVTIREKVVGPKDVLVAETYDRLAWALMDRNPREARQAFQHAISIMMEVQGDSAGWSAQSLIGLSQLARREGHADEARRHLEQALKIAKTNQDIGNTRIAEVEVNLADLAREQGRVAEAIPLYERGIETGEQALGPSDPFVARSLQGYAGALREAGRVDEAFAAALRAESAARDHLRLTVGSLPERQALQYGSVRVSTLDFILETAVKRGAGDESFAARAHDALIRSRAVVLDEMAQRRSGLRALGAPDSLVLAHESARRRLAHLLVRGQGDRSIREYRGQIQVARHEAELAERALAEASASFRAQNATKQAGVEAVASALPSKTALVSFARYEGPGSAQYVAFLLSGSKPSQMVPLGAASRIDSLVIRWRREIDRGMATAGSPQSVAHYRQVAAALRGAVWDPLAKPLEGADLVLVVPDGSLHLVNFAALPVGRSDYLVVGGPSIHYLSAERDLVAPLAPTRPGTGLLAMGHPDYDASALDSGPQMIASAGDAGAPTRTAYRGSRSHCPELSEWRWESLPATEPEVQEVTQAWRAQADRGDALLLTDRAASEAAFKRDSPGRRALHLATHGFFLGEHCRSAEVATRGLGGFSRRERFEPPKTPKTGGTNRFESESPLLLSGLIFAGANRTSASSVDAEDGVLTGEEIAALDLTGVEWAVLSACETGLGRLEAREGVLGLRRAFETAGVRTLIMSLWPVEDEAARQWMRRLYEARYERGLGTAETIRSATRGVLEARRASGLSTHPFFWAGYVAAGDWR